MGADAGPEILVGTGGIVQATRLGAVTREQGKGERGEAQSAEKLHPGTKEAECGAVLFHSGAGRQARRGDPGHRFEHGVAEGDAGEVQRRDHESRR